jgi:hypothetical protein
MASKDIDSKNLMVTGAHATTEIPSVRIEDHSRDIFIIVTQAYGPKGDNLVGVGEVTFDGFPAVTVKVKAGGHEELVHLSPFHGDARKVGGDSIEPGTRCELFCPVSGEPLETMGAVGEGEQAQYFAIYLTPELSKGEMVALSNVWDDYRSRIIDGSELISAWNEAV